MKADNVKQALGERADDVRAKHSARFFKTGPGQYGQGDKFIGVTVPEQRKVALAYQDLPEPEVIKLLHSPIHEHRLTALFILVSQYRRSDPQSKKRIASIYHKQRSYINNWDLVDSSAPYILGDYLLTHSPNVIYRMAASNSLWDRRIAIISTFAWIKRGELDHTIRIATLLLGDKEDLIHKATGWALREVGKKDPATLLAFLDQHASAMPRTALRYSIERLTPEQRQLYLAKRSVSTFG